MFFAALAPFRSRWRMLVGGLVACGPGSYLLVDLGLVARKPFVIGRGIPGLLVALAAYGYVRQAGWRRAWITSGTTNKITKNNN